MADKILIDRYGAPEGSSDMQLIKSDHPLPIFVYTGHDTLVKSNLFRALLEVALQTKTHDRLQVSTLLSCLYFGLVLTQDDLKGLDDYTEYQFVVAEVTDEEGSRHYPKFKRRNVRGSPPEAEINQAVIEIIQLQHFTHTHTRKTDDDIDDIICQLWIVLSKAVTEPLQAASNFTKLFSRLAPDFGIARANGISSNAVKALMEFLVHNINVRRAMINYIVALTSRGTAMNRVQKMLKALSGHLTNEGLTSFVITKKCISAKNTFFVPEALCQDQLIFNSLQKLYESLGDLGPYLKIYGHPRSSTFAPVNYPSLFSFALGYAREMEPSMRNYEYNERLVTPRWMELGTAAAQQTKARQTVTEGRVSEEKGRTKEKHERTSLGLDDDLKRVGPEGLGTESARATVRRPQMHGEAAIEEARRLMELQDLTETRGEAQDSSILSGTFARSTTATHDTPSLGSLPTRDTRPWTTTTETGLGAPTAPMLGAIPKRPQNYSETPEQKGPWPKAGSWPNLKP